MLNGYAFGGDDVWSIEISFKRLSFTQFFLCKAIRATASVNSLSGERVQLWITVALKINWVAVSVLILCIVT